MQPELRAAIVQDAETGRVLMLAWMDDEAERLTRETGEAWFWSRSRQRALAQGRDVRATRSPSRSCATTATATRCSLRVRPNGPACHTGSVSCFAPWLWRTVAERASERPEGSYVAGLLDAASPRARARSARRASRRRSPALGESDERVVAEVADLWFHSYVLLAARGLDPAAVEDELARRRR